MKKAWKILLGLFVLTVAIIVSGIAVLKSTDFNKYKGLIAKEVKAATGRDLIITGDLSLSISLNPSLSVEGVSFANAPWGSRPEMVKLKRLEAEVALPPLLSGDVRVGRLVLIGFDALLETDAKGRGNWEFAKAGTKSKKGGGVLPVVRKVRLEDVNLTYLDGRTGQKTKLRIKSLDAEAEDKNSPLVLSLIGSLNGEALRLSGRVGSIASLIGGGAPWPVSLTLSGLGIKAAIEGSLTKPRQGKGLDLKVSASADNLAPLGDALGVKIPALPPLDIAARLTDPAGGYLLDGIRFKAGKSGLAGRIALSLPKGRRPDLKADLTSDFLDLNALLPAASKGPKKTQENAEDNEAKRLFPDDPLPLEGLKAINADIAVKVSRMVLPGGTKAENVLLKTVLKNGRLSLKPLSAGLAGGTVKVDITLDGAMGKTAKLDVKIKADGLKAGLLAKDMGAMDLLSGGKTDIDIVLKGRGASVRKLMGSLNGKVKMVAGEAKIKNTAINWAGADFLSELGQAINPMAKKDDYTVLKCGVIRFEVSNGIAKAQKGVAVETDKMDVIGSGAIDLKTEAIDFSIRPQARQGLGISLGDQVASLVRLKGTLADPKLGIDEEEAVKAAAEVGAAIATGGISILGTVLIDKLSADETPCRTALGLGPKKSKAPKKSNPKASETDNLLNDAAEGLKGGLKGLFGLGK